MPDHPRPARFPRLRGLDGRGVFARNSAMLDEVGLLPHILTGIGLVFVAIGLDALALNLIDEKWTLPSPLWQVLAATIPLPCLIWGARLILRRRIGYGESLLLIGYSDAATVATILLNPPSGVSVLRAVWLIGICSFAFALHGRVAGAIQATLTIATFGALGAIALAAGQPVITVLSMVGTAAAVVLAFGLFVEVLELQFQDQNSRLSAMLRRDDLTGLLNRRGLAAACLHREDTVTVALLDLDGFKPVNDTHGHAVGDRVLIRTAQHLVAVVGDDALIARLGGDEFAVVAEYLPTDLGERFAAATARDRFPVVASVGFAVGPAGTLDELLHDADAAMYRAKRNRSREAA